MKVTGAALSLDRFLEIKQAAEKRMMASPAAKPAASGAVDFTKLIGSLKAFSQKTEAPVAQRPAGVAAAGPVELKKAAQGSGFTALYQLNRALAGRFSENPADEVVARNRHLGNLFDRVA